MFRVDDLTIAQAKEIASMFSQAEHIPSTHPWKIGGKYFIRTVTHHYTGRLVAVHQQELVIEEAAWIADDGRFSTALATSTFSEVEPYPPGPVIIGRGSVLDATEIAELPRVQK